MIESVTIETYAMAATMASAKVATPFGTRFSIPIAVAARLLGVEGQLDDEGIAPSDNQALHALAQSVAVRENPAFTRAWPDRQISEMRIVTRAGTSRHATADFIAGEAERPHPETAMQRKFFTLTAPSWGSEATAALGVLRRIEAVPDMRALTTEWRGAAARRQETA